MKGPLAIRLADRVRLGPFSRRLLTAALFLTLVAVGAADRWTAAFGGGAPYWAPSLTGYVSPGENLIHGIRTGAVSYHLPLASVAAALLYGHLSLSMRTCAIFAAALTLALLLAVAGILELGVSGMASIIVLWAFFPASGGLADYPQWLLSDLVLLVAAMAAWRARAPSYRNTFLLAASIGISLLLRSTLAFFAPALVLFELAGRPEGTPRARRGQALILLVVPVLFLIPWMRMNWIVSRRVVMFEDKEASCNVVTGALGIVPTVDGPWQALVPKTAQESTRGLFVWAAEESLRHPARSVAAYLKRLWLVLGPWQFPLSLLAVTAIWRRRRRQDLRALAFLAAYFVGIHCFMSVQQDYFDPLRYLLILIASPLFASSARPRPAALARFGKSVAAAALAAAILLGCYTEARVSEYASAGAEGRPFGRTEREPKPRSGDAWLLLSAGLRDLQNGAAAEASRAFELAARLQPQNPNAAFLAAKAAAFSGHFSLLTAPPNDYWDDAPEYFMLRADADLASGNTARAVADMNAARDMAMKFSAAHGPADSREREFVERLRSETRSRFIAEIGSRLHDWPPSDLRRIAALLVKMGLVKAADGGPAGTAAIPTHAPRRRLSLDEQRRLRALVPSFGRDAGAIALLPAMTRSDGSDASLLLDTARAFAKLGRKDSAEASLAEAARRAGDPDERLAAALVYQDLGNYARARVILEPLAAEYPKEAPYANALGVCEYLAGDSDGALRAFRSLIAAFPRYLPPYLSLGMIDSRQGRDSEAAALYRKALSNDRGDDPDGPRRQLEEALRNLLAKGTRGSALGPKP